MPTDVGFEVAMIGRSNAGKSTLINCLAQRHQLARASKTPGRTQWINIFEVDAKRRLIDLPGYGYAKASRKQMRASQTLIQHYLAYRQCLRALMLLMDARHPLQASDQCILEWASHRDLALQIVLTKSDKLSRHALRCTQWKLCKTLGLTEGQVITFSAKTPKVDLDQIYTILDHFLGAGEKK